MYFSGSLTIDPAQLTNIERIRPQKAFRRMLHHLTAGLVSDQEEHETFTAVAILQQLNQVFRQLGITDIIRLSHDGIDFYHDTEGKKDDLKEAFDQYDLSINEAMSKVFEQLVLVVDHQRESLYYLIEVTVNRTHAVGDYPIAIKVNGLLREFCSETDAEHQQVEQRMSAIFTSQQHYDAFVRKHAATFEAFLYDLQLAIQRVIRVDDVQVSHHRRLIAPQRPDGVRRRRADRKPVPSPRSGNYDPVFGEYPAADLYFPYMLLWSDSLHDHHIQIQEVDILTEDGELLGSIDEECVDAGELPILDEDTTYEEGMAATTKHETYAQEADTTSWFGSDWGGDDSSNCSSCSSCSSCGGD